MDNLAEYCSHPLTSQVIDPDLGVGDTTIESALGIGLVLAVAIALGRSPTHLLKTENCIISVADC